MAKKKLNAKNILILTACNLILGLVFSISLAYIMEWPILWTMAMVNVMANLPLLRACSDALRQEFGLRSPTQVIGNWSKRVFGRRIPINSNGKQTDIFMQTLALNSGSQQQAEIAELENITVWHNDNSHTVTMPELEQFLYVAWRRQTQGKAPFSRHYWTKQRRPIVKVLRYNIMMTALISCDGLVIDRDERRSGRLSLSPYEAIKVIKATC